MFKIFTVKKPLSVAALPGVAFDDLDDHHFNRMIAFTKGHSLSENDVAQLEQKKVQELNQINKRWSEAWLSDSRKKSGFDVFEKEVLTPSTNTSMSSLSPITLNRIEERADSDGSSPKMGITL